jgi:uncharacterized protein (TIGR00725 family)
MSGTPYVAVVGPGEASSHELAAAEEIGGALAAAGAVVVTGGLGGVMEAACRGARAHGGHTLGILPGEHRSAANAWVEVAVATGMGELRNGLVVRAADALVAVGGGHGTLSEVGSSGGRSSAWARGRCMGCSTFPRPRRPSPASPLI